MAAVAEETRHLVEAGLLAKETMEEAPALETLLALGGQAVVAVVPA